MRPSRRRGTASRVGWLGAWGLSWVLRAAASRTQEGMSSAAALHPHVPVRLPAPAGGVKVTAFDRLSPKPLAPGSCDVLVLGAGTVGAAFQGLPLERLPAVVVTALSGGDAGAAAGEGAQRSSEDIADTVLIVCCHAARDERCGHIGPPLAAKLAELAAAEGQAGGLRVLKSSHIGGHKVGARSLQEGTLSKARGQRRSMGHPSRSCGELGSSPTRSPSRRPCPRPRPVPPAVCGQRYCVHSEAGRVPGQLVWRAQPRQRRRVSERAAGLQGERTPSCPDTLPALCVCMPCCRTLQLQAVGGGCCCGCCHGSTLSG